MIFEETPDTFLAAYGIPSYLTHTLVNIPFLLPKGIYYRNRLGESAPLCRTWRPAPPRLGFRSRHLTRNEFACTTVCFIVPSWAVYPD